jgi:hypothetical protein
MGDTTIRRVYIVRAQDYSRGTVQPMRIATADTLAAMIERCAADIGGAKAEHAGIGSCDLSVIVTVANLEVSDGK